MTEDDAEKKWCPFVRFTPPSERCDWESNRPQNVFGAFCIASRCMAWRATDNECGPQHPDDKSPAIYKPAGYCGLAGVP